MRTFAFIIVIFLFPIAVVIASGEKERRSSENIDHEQQQLEWCFQYSNRLGYTIQYINNPRLFQTVCEWMGTPYKYSGCNKNGTDCSGFVNSVFLTCYDKKIANNSAEMFKASEPLKRTDLREGDLVFFKIKSSRISHVGIYLGQNRFAHASASKGVMVSHLEDPYWGKYFYKGGRIKN